MKSNIKKAEEKRAKWSMETFDCATPLSSLTKAKEEIGQIERDILNGKKEPEEYADAIMCLFDSAKRQGISFSDIEKAYIRKVDINIHERKWVKNPDNTYSHIKEEEKMIFRYVITGYDGEIQSKEEEGTRDGFIKSMEELEKIGYKVNRCYFLNKEIFVNGYFGGINELRIIRFYGKLEIIK